MSYPLEESPFAEEQRRELKSAREKHGPQHSGHEAYAVLLEEVEEFWALVKQRTPGRAAMLEELIQIAAMAQRAAEDLELIAR